MLDSCWTHEGALTKDGYGRTTVNGRTVLLHRASYEVLVGDIPEGHEIDHLCRNRACYNPRHLEPVSHLENVRRGVAGQLNLSKTHCPFNHLLDGRQPNGARYCKKCKMLKSREYRAQSR